MSNVRARDAGPTEAKSAGLYDSDFYAWSNQQAALLRSGDFARADIAHIAEEIETLGRSEKRDLESRLTVLLMHLLKCRFQPDRRGRSWQLSIDNARHAIERHLRDNPSLKAKIREILADSYDTARREGAVETEVPLGTFPPECPWSFDQAMQDAP
jgi:hypothetical protein